MRHYNLRKQGFFEETRWHSNDQILPLSSQMNGTKSDVRSLGYGFLRRFHNPTIFLKVACDGPLLLPIIVGEFAIESLVDTLSGGKIEGYQDQFKFIKNLVGSLGYEVKMVRIVKRVVNTYYARIFLGKPSEGATLSIDSRPSDAIHLALKYQAPIYISKDIVVKDAIKIVYGTWNGSSVKTVYDVLLDSAPEGPDGLSEELDLIRKLNVAVREERFQDAAACRDQLSRFRLKGLSSSS
ncbi:wound-responsive family protein isoform X2 [Wolffia australiana]